MYFKGLERETFESLFIYFIELACPPKVVPSVKLVFVQTERNKEYDT